MPINCVTTDVNRMLVQTAVYDPRLLGDGKFKKIEEVLFLIGIVGCAVQLGPLGTAATHRPIVPAPGVYDDGDIGGLIGRGHRSTWRKPSSMPFCPP
jgi:hypothetical protein